jgi:hypothetical protein
MIGNHLSHGQRLYENDILETIESFGCIYVI